MKTEATINYHSRLNHLARSLWELPWKGYYYRIALEQYQFLATEYVL